MARKKYLICAFLSIALISLWPIYKYGTLTGFTLGIPDGSVRVVLPDGSGHIVFLRNRIHLWAAKYDRAIRFETDIISGVTRPLPINSGGPTKIDVYWLEKQEKEGSYIRLHDHRGEYLIDLSRGVTQLIGRINGRVFVSELKNNRMPVFGWTKVDGELSRVHTGKKEAEEITGRLASLQGKFIGRIDATEGPLRFITLTEPKEEELNHGAEQR